MDSWDQDKLQKGLKICHNNIRSLLPKIDEFETTYLDGKLDVMGVTETWLHKYVDDNLICNNQYDLIRNDRKGKKGGGLCMFIKKTLKYEVVNGSLIDSDCEIQLIILERSFRKTY